MSEFKKKCETFSIQKLKKTSELQNSKRNHNQKYLGYEEGPGHVCMKEPFPPNTHETNTDVRFVMSVILDVISIPAILCSFAVTLCSTIASSGLVPAGSEHAAASPLTCCPIVSNTLEQIPRIHTKCSPCFIWLRT